MRRLGLVFAILILLAGCNVPIFGSQTIIDWIDFVNWDGKKYYTVQSGALADEKFIGEKIGKVNFTLEGNVNNPNYKSKDGDAAFLEKGTVLYSIKNQPDLLAAKVKDELNGYRIYSKRDFNDDRWDFKKVPLEKVKKIEIYESIVPMKKRNEIKEPDKIKFLLQYLENGKEDSGFQYDTSNGDPKNFDLVLYTDEPIAYKYFIQYDGTTYFWYPSEASILPHEIGQFFIQ